MLTAAVRMYATTSGSSASWRLQVDAWTSFRLRIGFWTHSTHLEVSGDTVQEFGFLPLHCDRVQDLRRRHGRPRAHACETIMTRVRTPNRLLGHLLARLRSAVRPAGLK